MNNNQTKETIMKNLIPFFLTLTVLVSVNAQRGKKVKGNGNVVTIERTTGDYDGLRVGGFYEVKLVEGTEGKITLSGEDNLLEYIETEVKGGTLTIKSRDNMQLKVSNGERILITIPVEEIDAIRLSGSGKLYATTTLKADSFKVHTSGARNAELLLNVSNLKIISSGSSNIKLGGSTEKLNITSSGSSSLNAYNLKATDAEITSSGSSDIRLAVTDVLRTKSSGSSNIRYRGNPSKEYAKTTGSSSVSRQ